MLNLGLSTWTTPEDWDEMDEFFQNSPMPNLKIVHSSNEFSYPATLEASHLEQNNVSTNAPGNVDTLFKLQISGAHPTHLTLQDRRCPLLTQLTPHLSCLRRISISFGLFPFLFLTYLLYDSLFDFCKTRATSPKS